MKKYTLIFLLLSSACTSKLKEKNEILIPPVFQKEYQEYINGKI